MYFCLLGFIIFMKQISLIGLLFAMLCQYSYAQDTTGVKKKKMHGTFYVMWGYHKDYYTNSDVHFQDSETDNYDFTMHHAKAHDSRDMDDLLNKPLTVPQYIVYGGYFFNNKGDWGIEAGWDHLKYIVTDGQTVRMTGQIRGTQYDQDTTVTAPFFHYEHTNGNNYLTASLVKRNKLYASPNGHYRISALFKGGGGLLIPKTESYVLGNHRDGPFRVAGYVFTLGTSIRYDIYRYFFLEAGIKGAYARYTYDKIYGEGHANHNFLSAQFILSLGFNIPLSKD
jgi:hypothetical protein